MLSIRGNDFIAFWHTRNRFHRMLSKLGTNFRACSASGKMWTLLNVQSMLSIRGTNFIAHWAYGELILSHAEHTGNRFHRMLSMRGNNQKSNILAESNTIFKNLVLQALGTIDSVSAKKVKKKISCLCTFKNLMESNWSCRGCWEEIMGWILQRGCCPWCQRNLKGQSREMVFCHILSCPQRWFWICHFVGFRRKFAEIGLILCLSAYSLYRLNLLGVFS